MGKNIFAKTYGRIKKLIDYTPPLSPKSFSLDEARPYDSAQPLGRTEQADEIEYSRSLAMIDFAKRLCTYLEKLSESLRTGSFAWLIDAYKSELSALEKQWRELSPLLFAYEGSQDPDTAGISTSLEKNRQTLAEIYRLPRNNDLMIREIAIGRNKEAAGLIVYLEGIVDSQKLSRFVLEPLLTTNHPVYGNSPGEELMKQVFPAGGAKRVGAMDSLQKSINAGNTAVIIDGLDEAIAIDTKGGEQRGVDSPKTEQTIRGSLNAFTENLRTNTGLVRSILKASDLVTETVVIGARGQLNCAVMYIDSIANPSLVAEVRRRLEGIKTDYISDSSQLAQFIVDRPSVLFPQTLSTERPDRVANNLVEGRVALILEGNPFAQILPVSFLSFFHSGEDFSLNAGIANSMRAVRLIGALVSTVLPAFYLAIAYYHPEAMPTELLLAVAGFHENVPFPAWLEVLMMDLSFELIREASVRVPGILGSTIGIVGAIVLGQAAVTARIVSPIVVVIIAITGLASFAIPEYRMASAMRLLRFVLSFAAVFWGLVGLAAVLLCLTGLITSMKSFGVPYFAPMAPKTAEDNDVIVRGQVYNQEKRPDELNTKDTRRQPPVSRQWIKEPPEGDHLS